MTGLYGFFVFKGDLLCRTRSHFEKLTLVMSSGRLRENRYGVWSGDRDALGYYAIMKIIIMILIGVFFGLSVSYGDEGVSGETARTVSGSVAQIDWVGSKITIRVGSFGAGGVDELTLYVPNDAVMTSGTEEITLSDIDQGDEVEIEYVRKSFAGLYVKRLQDSNLLNHHGA
jgi:hypothetical protein